MTSSQVLPLLLESVCSQDANVQLSTLNGILSILTESPTSVTSHIPAFLPQLLSLSCNQSSLVGNKILELHIFSQNFDYRLFAKLHYIALKL